MSGVTGMLHGHKPAYEYKSRLWRCTCGTLLTVEITKDNVTDVRPAFTQHEARSMGMRRHRETLNYKRNAARTEDDYSAT